MAIAFTPVRREATLRARGLDALDAAIVFAGLRFEQVDDRKDHRETRYVMAGPLRDRMMVVVGTQRGADRHVPSMRRADDREQARFPGSVA